MFDNESIFLAFHCIFHRIMHGFILNKLLSPKKDMKVWVWSITESSILTLSSKIVWINDLFKMWKWKKIEKWARNWKRQKHQGRVNPFREMVKFEILKEEFQGNKHYPSSINIPSVFTMQCTLMSYWESLRLSLASRALLPRAQDKPEMPCINVTGRVLQSIMDRIWYISIPDSSSPDGTI